MMVGVEVDSVLVERAYAKINLTLDVLGRRPDGYHQVDMVMQTVDLSDLVWVEETEGDEIKVDSTATNIPLDSRNLVVVAAQAFQQFSGIRRGLNIRIEKNIPVAAGLAGGSADAAAVLRGLNRLYGTNYSSDQLAEIGASIGSDVPFCVYGGCAVATGRGELIRRIYHHMRPWVVLTRPPVYVSTAEVYNATSQAQYATSTASDEMVRALEQGDFEAVRSLVSNGLQQTTFRLYPEVALVKERMEAATGQPVFMSGSGPTLFALLPTQSAAQRMYNTLRGFMREVYLCRFALL